MPVSPYSARPGSLDKPVPNADMAAAAQAFMKDQKAPELQAPPDASPPAQASAPVPQQDMAAAAQAFMQGQTPAAGEAPAPAEAQPQPSMTQLTQQRWHDLFTKKLTPQERQQADALMTSAAGPSNIDKWLAATLINNTTGLPQQVRDFPLRAKVGMAANQKEQFDRASDALGKDNVRMTDGNIEFRYPGAADFRPLFPKGFEVLNDTVGSPRQLAKEALLTPAAAVAGALTEGNPVAMAAARSALSTPANWIADKVAAWSGVKEDLQRSKLLENVLDSTMELAIPFALHKVAQSVPGTKAFEKKMLSTAANEVQVNAEVRSSIEASKALEEGGWIQDLGDGVKLRLDQLLPNDPQVLQVVQEHKDKAGFVNAQTMQAESVMNSARKLLAQVAGFSGKEPDALVEGLGGTIRELDRAEGEAIGGLRTKAMAQLKNEKLPLPDELNQQAANMMKELGFTAKLEQQTIMRRAGSWQSAPSGQRMAARLVYTAPKDMQPILGKLGITEPGTARSFINALEDFANTSDNGLRISEIDRLTKVVGDLYPKAAREGGAVKQAWGEFSSTLRQFRRDAIKAGLPNEIDQRAFDATMDKFSKIRANTQDLQGLLEGNFTSDTIVKQVFNKGKAGLENLQAIKALTMKDAPDTWAALKQAWVDDMFERHSTGSTTGAPFDFVGMKRELAKYGDSFLSEALEGSGVDKKTLNDMMSYGKLVQETFRAPGAAASIDEATKKSIYDGLAGLALKIKTKSFSGFSKAIGLNVPGNGLEALITPEGIDAYLAKYRGGAAKKQQIEQSLLTLLKTGKAQQQFPRAFSLATKGLQSARRGAINSAQTAAKQQRSPSGQAGPQPPEDDE